MNHTVTLGGGKERANREMKDILDAKKTELVGVMVRVMGKNGIVVN